MRKRLKTPCIRGLNDFKKGCPEKLFNRETGEGCPAWVEIAVTQKNDPENPIGKEGHCVDIWNSRLLHDAIKKLAGTQQSVESFRNNMSTSHGPKPNVAELQLLQELKGRKEQMQAVINHEVTKRLSEC